MTDQTPDYIPTEEGSGLLKHLIELRKRLLRIVVFVIVVFSGLYYFSNDLYAILANPLLQQLPQGSTLIATSVATPFLTPLKLTFAVAIFLAIPFILHQLWGFIAPGLYHREKRLIFPLLFSSILLFYLGMVFAYYIVFPLVFGFFTGIAPQDVTVMPDIGEYLDFTLTLFFAFGAAFEIPIVTLLLIVSGVTTADGLRSKRPYIIVAAFIIGMLLTPPDVISQILLAVPIWLLFEAGVFLSGFYKAPTEVK